MDALVLFPDDSYKKKYRKAQLSKLPSDIIAKSKVKIDSDQLNKMLAVVAKHKNDLQKM